jgi:hypothetical protein
LIYDLPRLVGLSIGLSCSSISSSAFDTFDPGTTELELDLTAVGLIEGGALEEG